MKRILPHLKHLKYMMRHKWYVYKAGRKLKVPLWRLLFHDWTKFMPYEWNRYTQFFFGNVPTTKTGGKKREATPEFELAWNHHQKHNDHHFQYWLRIGDDGTLLLLPMSDVARREMLADWIGAGLARNMPDTAGWYLKHKEEMKLHPETRLWIEEQLGL